MRSTLALGVDNGWSIPVCCGQGCNLSQSSCVFPDNRTPFGKDVECAAAFMTAPNGVICCMDPEVMN